MWKWKENSKMFGPKNLEIEYSWTTLISLLKWRMNSIHRHMNFSIDCKSGGSFSCIHEISWDKQFQHHIEFSEVLFLNDSSSNDISKWLLIILCMYVCILYSRLVVCQCVFRIKMTQSIKNAWSRLKTDILCVCKIKFILT